MSIHKDSYSTTFGSRLITKNIEQAIKESFIKDNLDKVNLNVDNTGEFKPVFITGALDNDVNIPLFTHPITIKNIHGSNYLVSDLRLYIKNNPDIKNIETSIKNLTEYNFAKSRAILSLSWLNDNTSVIKNNFSFAGIVYAAWLSEVISKYYALDFKDQSILFIIISFFYQSLFVDGEIDEEMKQKFATHTIKASRTTADFVFNIFDRIQTKSEDSNVFSLIDMCSNIVNILENVRLKNFNIAILLNIISNSWYGTNAKEILAIALEHPPTWCAIVYSAITEKTYKSSMIYRVAERFGKRGVSDEYLKNYKGFVEDRLSVAEEELSLEKI